MLISNQKMATKMLGAFNSFKSLFLCLLVCGDILRVYFSAY
jgi:hypothetical protein